MTDMVNELRLSCDWCLGECDMCSSLRAKAADEIEPRFGPCVIVKGRARWSHQVDAVAVFSGCPMELFDEAVESGFYVLGQPRGVTHDYPD